VIRTIYEMERAVVRIGVDEESRAKLKAVTPNMLACIPNEYDATIAYSEEPWAMLLGYLLDQAGVRKEALQTAFYLHEVSGVESVSTNFVHKGRFEYLLNQNIENHDAQ